MSDSSQNKKWIPLIIIIVLLSIALIVLGLHTYNLTESENKAWTSSKQKDAELALAYKKMDSVEKELSVRVAEVERLGGDVSSLKNIIQQIKREKNELAQKENVQYARYQELEGKIAGYEELILLKDAQIQELKVQNEALNSENANLKQGKDSLSRRIDDLAQNNSKLNRKLKAAAILKTQSITFLGITESGKEKVGDEFKGKQLEKLKISVRIAENNAVEAGNIRVALQLLGPEKTILTNTSTGGGSMEVNGKSMVYTLVKNILFSNQEQEINFIFVDEIFKSKRGQYSVVIFSEQGEMGRGSFIIK